MPIVEELYFGKGNSHPHLSQAPSIHTDAKKVTDLPLSKVVHIPAIIPPKHQVQEG